MEVGVRELKARLSQYLDRAESGETITVTERGRAKALLMPVSPEARIRALIDRAIDEGRITPGNGDPPSFPRRRFKGRMTVEELLREDRGD